MACTCRDMVLAGFQSRGEEEDEEGVELSAADNLKTRRVRTVRNPDLSTGQGRLFW